MAALTGARAALDALAGRVGRPIGEPVEFHVDQREEDIFACLIGDLDPMHNEPGWTFEGGWESTIVLGFHVLSFMYARLAGAGVPVQDTADSTFLSLGLDRVRFVSSLPVGCKARWSVTLTGIEERGDSCIVRTSHRVQIPGAERPMMVADHSGAVLLGHSDPRALFDDTPPAIAGAPAGRPVPVAERHGAEFYAGVLNRVGDSLGATPWTVVDKRSVDTFNLLSGMPGRIHSDPAWDREHSPWRTTTVNPLHLLALRSYFLPQVGLPVLTDEWMAAFNYGLDRARWYAPVAAGTRIRDHVQILDAREKDPGRYLVKTRHVVEAEGATDAVLEADTLTLFALKNHGETGRAG
jgi:acyl dehydratase